MNPSVSGRLAEVLLVQASWRATCTTATTRGLWPPRCSPLRLAFAHVRSRLCSVLAHARGRRRCRSLAVNTGTEEMAVQVRKHANLVRFVDGIREKYFKKELAELDK